jgi:hypothetical protein
VKVLKAFGHFWWDFLVGDTPEFAVVTLALVGLAYLLADHTAAAVIVLPLFVAGSLLVSTLRR